MAFEKNSMDPATGNTVYEGSFKTAYKTNEPNAERILQHIFEMMVLKYVQS